MRYFPPLALGLVLALAAAPAMAQLAGGGLGNAIGGKAPTPQPHTPDLAPPALPGAAAPSVATGPVLARPATGDPTAELFAAITKGDDAAAQNALGRGADLTARNQFGETPLDLAIALNRTSITFLLLQTRNELAAQSANAEPLGAPWLLNEPTPAPSRQKAAASYHPPAHKPPPAPTPAPPAGNSGTPDPSAGFLGFGPKN